MRWVHFRNHYGNKLSEGNHLICYITMYHTYYQNTLFFIFTFNTKMMFDKIKNKVLNQ